MSTSTDFDCQFCDYRLATVVTMSEVKLMWGLSKTSILFAIDRGKVSARKSVTGGSWLLSYDDCKKRWGEPDKPIEGWMDDEQ